MIWDFHTYDALPCLALPWWRRLSGYLKRWPKKEKVQHQKSMMINLFCTNTGKKAPGQPDLLFSACTDIFPTMEIVLTFHVIESVLLKVPTAGKKSPWSTTSLTACPSSAYWPRCSHCGAGPRGAVEALHPPEAPCPGELPWWPSLTPACDWRGHWPSSSGWSRGFSMRTFWRWDIKVLGDLSSWMVHYISSTQGKKTKVSRVGITR